jgi:hypothetical protein
MYRGDYREYPVTVTDTYSAAAEVHFAVKPKTVIDTVDAADSNALFTVTATSADAVDNGDGTVTYTLVIPSASTTGQTPGKYVAEIEYIDGDGHPTTFDQFDFTLKADVNQRP